MSNTTLFNKINRIYLFVYLSYIVLTTISKFTAYAPYLHLVYKITVVASILLNFIFIFILRKKGYNTFDYFVGIGLVILIFLRFSLQIQVITWPLIAIYLFILNLRYVDLYYFIKYDMITRFTMIIVIIILYLFHLTPNYGLVEYRNGIPRYSIGFNGYAEFSSIVFYFIVSYILFLNKRSYKLKNIVVLFSITLVMYYLTDTRGPLYSEILLIILLSIGKLKIKHIIESLSVPFYIILSTMAIIIPLNIHINNPYFLYLNKLFSNRLVLQQLVISIYKIKFFGYIHMGSLKMFNNNNLVYVDNSYLMLLLVGGIIGFIIFELIYMGTFCISIHLNNYILCIVLISVLILMITEITFNNINMYVPIFYAYILKNFHNNNEIE